ncbi:hypothetical protein I204_07763 [Kwoniella mangroviensis CBS 8886]|uniref:hypothetical protein n=1 Tax=Kwoniella mangroviensis CBS 8507 TaxID=1296122 RepID=UPI00080D1BCB|nr:uncharacterized protein I203_05253 [Kwoniella mangroviensis CBS 8507]OCF65577.1 hypothetical protein I203_05253 [Kwoniella mangroviensis CBS 8507]OCF71701.1 hypothetical protein I204_07763 [Kwoniella mangroviensis CBS 8886]
MSSTTYRGPINPNPKNDEASIIIYGYTPSLALGIIGIITFTICVSLHSFWLARKRGTRWFHSLILVGALMEIGGYAARLSSHKRPFVVSSFVAQYFLIVVAPVLFSAAIYLSLSIATRSYKGAERLLIISPRKVLIFFVTADIVTTVIQVVGAALIGSSESAKVRGNPSSVTPEQANDILLAGLAIQCFSFTSFLLLLLLTIYRSHQPTYTHHLTSITSLNKLRSFLYTILLTSLLILLRTTFRLAETGQGFFGFASTHESLFGTLEYLPVVLTLLIWGILPISKFVDLGQSRERERLDSAIGEPQTSQIGRNRNIV